MASLRHALSLTALSFVALEGAGTSIASVAHAQPAAPARVGWELGFGLHGGEINCRNENGDFCDGVTEAGGIDLHVNYFLRPKLGLTLDIWPMYHREEDWTFNHTVVTLGAKYRPVPIVTLTAGVGSAQARWSYRGIVNLDAETDTVPSLMFGAGHELLRTPSFALDVQARVGIGFYAEDDNDNGEADIEGRNVAVGAGLTWF
jgi:hypothetical protein